MTILYYLVSIYTEFTDWILKLIYKNYRNIKVQKEVQFKFNSIIPAMQTDPAKAKTNVIDNIPMITPSANQDCPQY